MVRVIESDVETWMPFAMLFCAGSVAGAIDSVAGGGGLITLPALLIFFGPTSQAAHSIGTNKIVGCLGALIALAVYLRKGWFRFRESIFFASWAGLGSWIGSRWTAYLPFQAFQVLLWIACPLIFFVIWNKDIWLKEWAPRKKTSVLPWRLVFVGLACGIYDGGFGPGGGTFMFLGLVFLVGMPVVAAMAASKFVNTVTAGTALVSFGVQGFVHWPAGLAAGAGMACGAFVGARAMTTQPPERTVQLLRIALGVVMILLLLKSAL